MGVAGTELTVFRRYTWWSLTGTVTGMLLLLVGRWLATTPLPTWALLTCTAALASTAAALGVLFAHRLGAGPGGTWVPAAWVAAAAGATVLAVVLLVLGGELWAFAPACVLAAAVTFLAGPRRWALVACGALVAGLLGALAGPGAGWFAAWFPAGLVVVTAASALALLWAWDVAERLEQARVLSAELAVRGERRRFAGDLHDIQGHSLQAIALKSELAARLADGDPARAAQQMREVQELAATALADLRAVVQGYRRVTPEDELANAGRVLAAAGIDAQLSVEGPDLAEPARHLLGLVVREATTNILRHSQAATAELRLAAARLTVRNDGADAHGEGPAGGLRLLAERLAEAGGALEWRRDGDTFTLTAALPP